MKLIYTLQEGEKFAFLDFVSGAVAIVCHPDREPKIVYSDGRTETLRAAKYPTPVLVQNPLAVTWKA